MIVKKTKHGIRYSYIWKSVEGICSGSFDADNGLIRYFADKDKALEAMIIGRDNTAFDVLTDALTLVLSDGLIIGNVQREIMWID